MNYYLLEADTKSAETPKLVNWFQKIDTTCMIPERYHELEDIVLLNAKFAPNTKYREVVISPFFLIPEDVAKILSAFEPWMSYKNVILFDAQKKIHHKYQFPLLQKYACVSPKAVLNRDKTVIEKAVFLKEKMPDSVLFTLEGVKSRQVVAREDFVEVLLQEQYFGFRLRKAELV